MRKFRARPNPNIKKMERTDISEAPGLHRFGGRLKVLRSTRRYLKHTAQFFDKKNGTYDPLIASVWEIIRKVEEIETEVFSGLLGQKDEIEVEVSISKYFLRELEETLSESAPNCRDYDDENPALEDAIELMDSAWEEVSSSVRGLHDALLSIGDGAEFLNPSWMR